MTKKRKDIVKIVAITLTVLQMLFLIIYFNWEKRSSFNYPEKMPNNFNFKFEYGWGNTKFLKIDTYNNTLTSLINLEKDTTIEYHFSKIEKEKIYNTINEIDIYIYPENYAPTSVQQILPAYTYYFETSINSDTIRINWEENTSSRTKESQNLMKIFNEIFTITGEDERVKNLPECEIYPL